MGIGWNGPVNNYQDIRTIEEQRHEIRNLMNDRDAVVRQRDERRMNEVAWANTARTLAKKLGISFDDEVKKNYFNEALNIVKEDARKRGIKESTKNPPKFIMKK